MKKIDLHIHTQKCKKGDGSRRKVDCTKFIDIMQKNNIGICSITNHNKFDIEEFNYINTNKTNFLIFPGIELDVIFNESNVRHIIVVCSPESANEFKNIFSNDDKRDYDEYKINYCNFINNIKKFNKDKILIIPHFLNKDKERSLNIDEKDRLKGDLEGYTVILEPNLRTMGIINAHNEISLIGSDVKDWNKYSEDVKRLPELKFNIDSFGKFYELASQPEVFIKSVLSNCDKYEININLENTINIYKDVNVIFGGKGSGKTILLKDNIFPELAKNGKKVFIHEGKDYQNVYDNMIKEICNKIEIEEDKKESIICDLNYILKFTESYNQDFINKYLKYHENQSVTKKAKKIKKTECSYIKHNVNNIHDITEKYKKYKEKIIEVKIINNKVRNNKNPHKISLNKELDVLNDEVCSEYISECRDIFSISKTSVIVENIKEILDKKAGKKSKPSNIGFSKMVSERCNYLEKVKNINDCLENIKILKKIKIGELPDKGEIYIVVKIEVLDEDKKHTKGSPFDRNTIAFNRNFMKKISDFSVDNLTKISKIFTADELQKSADNYFYDCIKKSYEVIRENGAIYEPSEGEKSILSISGLIENVSYDCYLFDEIERGLGNKYISEYIIPKLKYLRDMGKTIILSTHNANIAINTLPIQTIYCNYIGQDNGEIYFTGNMYSNELISIKNTNNTLIWENEAIKHLEGSEQMFNVRRNIWKQ